MNCAPRFPLQVFYDGACPLCAREIAHYLRQDRHQRLQAVDISAADFDPKPYGIELSAFMAELHAIDQDGTVYRGVAAFRAIWLAFPDKAAYRVMSGLFALPLLEPLAQRAYRLFARLRPHLPGRKQACEQDRCGTSR
ncbi:MAG: DUF393 domain-containing protein [Desulfuromonadales bacterium]|nr:DUF393 domain-containing protein [Desulfuromonadales bacterium]